MLLNFTASLALFIITASADELSISVLEYKGYGASLNSAKVKKIASVKAMDEATRNDMLKLWRYAKKAIPKEHRELYGPDSGYIEIILKNGDERIEVRSWHPLFKNNQKVVVTSNGVEALNGRTKGEVLKSDKAWYKNLRTCFDEILTYAKNQ